MDLNNRRIAKNTAFLYFRMLISTIVSLYTSRIVLKTLGESDFGIYGIVGGIVILFTFLNASMSSSTSRFITFELGSGNSDRLRETFSNAIAIHLIIAGIVLFLAETIGLWIVDTKLSIPIERKFAAHVVYQLSILSTIISIYQVPYNSTIIAHERMDFYAYVELLHVFLKLIAVYLLFITGFDKLIIYSILMLSVSLIVTVIYRIYCMRSFQESRTKPALHKGTCKPMITFSVWALYGDACYSLRQQGTNILLNMFFGPIVNAASTIATTVLSITSGFAQNIITAFKPQIIKAYAIQDFARFNTLIASAAKFALLLLAMLVIILSFEMDYILTLWLENVPKYTPWICRITLATSCVVIVSFVIVVGVQATGEMKLTSFIGGTISIIGVLPTSFFLLKQGLSPYSTYLCYTVVSIVLLFGNVFILKHYVKEFDVHKLLLNGIMNPCVVIIITICVANVVTQNLHDGIGRFIIISITTIFLMSLLSYYFVLTNQEQSHLLQFAKKFFNR